MIPLLTQERITSLENEIESVKHSWEEDIVHGSHATKLVDPNASQTLLSVELALSGTSSSSYHTRLRDNLRYHPFLDSNQVKSTQSISHLTRIPLLFLTSPSSVLSSFTFLPESWPSVCATSCVVLMIISGDHPPYIVLIFNHLT